MMLFPPHVETLTQIKTRLTGPSRLVSLQEIALLQRTRRNATVVCAEACELLFVDKDDFMENGLHRAMDEEFQLRFNFFRSARSSACLQLFRGCIRDIKRIVVLWSCLATVGNVNMHCVRGSF